MKKVAVTQEKGGISITEAIIQPGQEERREESNQGWKKDARNATLSRNT